MFAGMPWWWPYLCWTLNGIQIAVLVWQVRMGRRMTRHLREAKQQRDKTSANLAESERLLTAIRCAPFGLPPGEDRETPTAH